MDPRQRFYQNITKQAIEAFKNHELIESDSEKGRWFIAARYKDGSLNYTHATEIISLWNGRLFVGGDIDDCVFAYYGRKENHIGKVRWIGLHKHVDTYIREKACIGMNDNHKLTTKWDNEVAVYDLEEVLKNTRQSYIYDDLDPDQCIVFAKIKEAIERAIDNVSEEEIMLKELYDDVPDLWESLNNIGHVCSARVFYAWAACRRLCELLEENNEVEKR